MIECFNRILRPHKKGRERESTRDTDRLVWIFYRFFFASCCFCCAVWMDIDKSFYESDADTIRIHIISCFCMAAIRLSIPRLCVCVCVCVSAIPSIVYGAPIKWKTSMIRSTFCRLHIWFYALGICSPHFPAKKSYASCLRNDFDLPLLRHSSPHWLIQSLPTNANEHLAYQEIILVKWIQCKRTKQLRCTKYTLGFQLFPFHQFKSLYVLSIGGLQPFHLWNIAVTFVILVVVIVGIVLFHFNWLVPTMKAPVLSSCQIMINSWSEIDLNHPTAHVYGS